MVWFNYKDIAKGLMLGKNLFTDEGLISGIHKEVGVPFKEQIYDVFRNLNQESAEEREVVLSDYEDISGDKGDFNFDNSISALSQA